MTTSDKALRHALTMLVHAIEENTERRVLLDRRPGERRTETVVLLRDIDRSYRHACMQLGDAPPPAPAPGARAVTADDIFPDPPTKES